MGFLYHVLGPPGRPHVKHLFPYKTQEAFEQDLAYLGRRFRLVTCEEIAAPPRAGLPMAHLSFDDGYAEGFTVARPVLLRLGVPCTFFLTTGFIDNRTLFYRNKCSLCIEALLGTADREAAAFLRDLGRRLGRPFPDRDAFGRFVLGLGPDDEARIDDLCARLGIDIAGYLREERPYMSTDEIRRLASEGFTIGAHGRRHLRLGALSAEAIEDEITGSCHTIAELTGRSPVPFSFPHSADGVDRVLLRRLTETHASVGRLFGTRRLSRDGGLIVNRVVVDAPPATPGATNLPDLLRAAYRDAAAESLRQFLAARAR